MRLLKKIFGHKREKERIETLGKIFPYSRAEDMAKVFELGRIHALRQLKPQVYAGLGTLALVITIGGYYFVQDYLQLKFNNIVESRVDKELDKRIENFSKFYYYAKETMPISILVLRASNDSREAFDKLTRISKDMEPHLKELKQLADDAIFYIIDNVALNVGPHISYRPDPTVSDSTDFDVYRKIRNWTYRVAFLEGISTSNRLSKRDKFEFAANVLGTDGSLRAVEAARQILEEEAKINGNIRNVDQYIDWWKRHREKY
jgi:hypothetical protein